MTKYVYEMDDGKTQGIRERNQDYIDFKGVSTARSTESI